MHQQFVKVNFIDASPIVGSLSRRPRKACASISLPTCYNNLHCAGMPICKGWNFKAMHLLSRKSMRCT